MSLTDLIITQASARIHAGDLSPVDLLLACRERIDRLDEQLRAWVCFNENAEAEARPSTSRYLSLHRRRGAGASVWARSNI